MVRRLTIAKAVPIWRRIRSRKRPGRSGIPGQLKNQFGGSIGGPILKNKLFFFGDYQGVRQKVGTSNVQTVPSSLLVETCLGKQIGPGGIPGCDFSEYAANVTPAGTGIIYQTNGVAYPKNVIRSAAQGIHRRRKTFSLAFGAI